MTRGLHWFRNDLRLHDNRSLAALAERADEWLPVFVMDPRLMGTPTRPTARLRFMQDCLERLGRALEKRGVPLIVRQGRPEEVIPELLAETGAELLSFNPDVTPFARRRDDEVQRAAESHGVEVLSRTDRVVFAASEVRTKVGGPFAVYTPYRKAWLKRWKQAPRHPAPTGRLPKPIPGFKATPPGTPQPAASAVATPTRLPTGGEDAARRRLSSFLAKGLEEYHLDRDRPDREGTSGLSCHLRFGTISPRQCVVAAEEWARDHRYSRIGAEKWIDELIWREFYAAVLFESPRSLRHNHRPCYDSLQWNDDPEGFEAWCDGRTGYPIVDAGMRQLRATGWMHNRVRMIVASFLTKDLLIDWRAGERFFFEHLVDGDPASNSAGWQWVASTGTDSQPYFRVFNPVSQGRRFDPDGAYVRRWVPELRGVPDRTLHAPWEGERPVDYPAPIVDHAERRLASIDRFRTARAMADPA